MHFRDAKTEQELITLNTLSSDFIKRICVLQLHFICAINHGIGPLDILNFNG